MDASLDGRRRLAVAAAGLLALATLTLAVLLRATPALGERQIDIGFADYLYNEDGQSNVWMDRTAQVGADVIRVNMYWGNVAPSKPENPRDPGDPAYAWKPFDTAISNAAERGLEVDLTVLYAPPWAEGPRRPPVDDDAPAGSWKPDPRALGDFAHAVARRYSGSYEAGGRTLPRVEYFEAWNEPNLHTYITPQYNGRRNVAAGIYVRLLNSFYEEVKGVDPSMKVVTGGTAPYGDPPSGRARKTSPLRFYRELLCLSPKLRRSGCAAGQRAKFDILAHHPINREDPPTAHAEADDDVEVADFGELARTLRRAEKLGTTGTPGRHGLWANEVWWQTDPPDKGEGVSLKTHARWTQQAIYLLWKQGASNVSFLQFRDAKYTPGEYTLDSYQTGIYTFGNRRKPTATAVSFPFVTDRRGPRNLLAWGRAPKSGRLKIEVKRGGRGFRKLTTVRVREGRVFTKRLRLSGRQELRAVVGGKRSLIWSQRD